MKTPKDMTAEEFFGTDDIVKQLAYIVKHSAWNVPTHLLEDVARRAGIEIQQPGTYHPL
jgi:hypothetical protein